MNQSAIGIKSNVKSLKQAKTNRVALLRFDQIALEE